MMQHGSGPTSSSGFVKDVSQSYLLSLSLTSRIIVVVIGNSCKV